MSLAEYVQLYPELLGERITKHHGATLPFLLKVLSIGHPLQLQIHPTKVLDITNGPLIIIFVGRSKSIA